MGCRLFQSRTVVVLELATHCWQLYILSVTHC
nr:MAG TPA: hypothetical protein [Caudoviricetes sp.]